MKDIYTTHIIDEIKKELAPFDSMDLNDPDIVIGLNAVVHSALYRIQQGYPGIESDLFFHRDHAPYLHITWCERITGFNDSITFRFNPIRVEQNQKDLIKAHDRAMKIV